MEIIIHLFSHLLLSGTNLCHIVGVGGEMMGHGNCFSMAPATVCKPRRWRLMCSKGACTFSKPLGDFTKTTALESTAIQTENSVLFRPCHTSWLWNWDPILTIPKSEFLRGERRGEIGVAFYKEKCLQTICKDSLTRYNSPYSAQLLN